MDTVIIFWDDLLKILAQKQENFLPTLVNDMLKQLVNHDTTNEVLLDGILAWLEHIFSEDWYKTARRSKLQDSHTISECLQNPTRWSIQLASSITECAARKRAKALYGPRVAEAVRALGGAKSSPEDFDVDQIATGGDGTDRWQASGSTWQNEPIGVS